MSALPCWQNLEHAGAEGEEIARMRWRAFKAAQVARLEALIIALASQPWTNPKPLADRLQRLKSMR